MENNINKKIENFIFELNKEYKLFPYLYLDDNTFDPDKSTVLYSAPYWTQDEIVSAIRSLLIGKWLVAGNDTHLFESKFAKAMNDKYALLVNSGSSANLIMFAAAKEKFGWKDGSEILTGAIGFPTSLTVIVQNFLKPVFLDIEMDTLNIDLSQIENKITSNTVAIFLSPTLGASPDLDKILDICKKYKLVLLLDGCDSLGSKWRGKYLSEYAYCTSESLYSSHVISAIQGGVISSSDEELISIARRMASWGKSCYCQTTQNMLPDGTCKKRFSDWLSPSYSGITDHRYTFDYMGYNLIPPEFIGSIALEQLNKMEEIFEKRKQNYLLMSELFLKYIKGIRLPNKLENSDPIWFGNGIICESKELKSKLVSFLESRRIQTRNLFAGNLLLHKGFSHLDDAKKYPNATKILDLVFFTGNPPHYGPNILRYVESVLKEFPNE